MENVVDDSELVGTWKWEWKSSCDDRGERLCAHGVRTLCGDEHNWVATAAIRASLRKENRECAPASLKREVRRSACMFVCIEESTIASLQREVLR